jgi:hypothetical protein
MTVIPSWRRAIFLRVLQRRVKGKNCISEKSHFGQSIFLIASRPIDTIQNVSVRKAKWQMANGKWQMARMNLEIASERYSQLSARP